LHDFERASTTSFGGYVSAPPPPRLGRLAHHSAALFGADVSPASRAETDRSSLNRLRRKSSTGEIENLDRQIEQDFRRKTGMTHEASQTRRAPRAQHPREFDSQIRTAR
jgi:hypothetical protein